MAAPEEYGSSQAGLELELQLLAYTTVTAKWDPSRVCNLHDSSQQLWILNPLKEARDRTCNLTVPSRIHFRCATTGTPFFILLYFYFSLPIFYPPSDMNPH